jgi:hypothetical protein
MCVKLGAQSQQRLQTDFHKHVIAGQAQETPQQLNDNHRKAKQRDSLSGIERWYPDFGAAEKSKGVLKNLYPTRKDLIDDDLEGPRFKQIQSDGGEGEPQGDKRTGKESAIVFQDASVDHRNFRLRIADCR